VYIRKKIKDAQYNVRIASEDLELIREAAKVLDTTVSELMIQATLDKIRRGNFRGTLRRLRDEGVV